MREMNKPTFSISAFGQKTGKTGSPKRHERLRRRKPKRQGSRDQRGKILPERQRDCRWRNPPCYGKEG